jgi:hypothetical protein
MLSCRPSNTRVLVHSTRGYKGSSLFSDTDSSEEQLLAQIGQDLASVVVGFIEKLSLISNPRSK